MFKLLLLWMVGRENVGKEVFLPISKDQQFMGNMQDRQRKMSVLLGHYSFCLLSSSRTFPRLNSLILKLSADQERASRQLSMLETNLLKI